MRSPAAILLLGAVPIAFGGGVAAASDVGKSYNLYHKLGDGSRLTPRGSITIAPSDADSGLVATYHPEQNAQLDTMAFDSMVEGGALYTLVVVEEGQGKPTSHPPTNGQYASASVPGCSLRRSNLREEIGLSLSPTGKLLSVSYRPVISPLAPKSCNKLQPLSANPEAVFGRKEGKDEEGEDNYAMPFKTTVSYDSHKPMMTIPTVLPPGQRPPPGLKWYRRNAKNYPDAKEGGIPGVDEKPSGFKSSFLYRYWYIILPMAIVGLFGGGMDEEEQRRAGPSGAAAGGVAAGAVATGSVSQARQRRGKRD